VALSGRLLTLAVKIVEPMMFRGPGEFTPKARGPQSSAVSQLLPSPSTFSGMLATALIDSGLAGSPNMGEWHNEIKEVLSSVGIRSVKGPYIIARIKEKEEILVQYMDKLVSLTKLYEKPEVLEGEEGEGLNKLEPITPTFTPKIGIGLDHMRKATKEGLIYTATMVDYSKLRKTTLENGKEKTVELRPEEVLIAADIKLENEDAIRRLSNLTLRMGGEGRVVTIKIRDRGGLAQKVAEKISELPDNWSGKAILYIATPLMTRSPPTEPTNWEHTKGGHLYPGAPPAKSGRWITIKAEPWGAGYRARISARKPVYTMIHPGSTIRLEEATKEQLKNMFEEPEILPEQIATYIGYATTIPVPLK